MIHFKHVVPNFDDKYSRPSSALSTSASLTSKFVQTRNRLLSILVSFLHALRDEWILWNQPINFPWEQLILLKGKCILSLLLAIIVPQVFAMIWKHWISLIHQCVHQSPDIALHTPLNQYSPPLVLLCTLPIILWLFSIDTTFVPHIF